MGRDRAGKSSSGTTSSMPMVQRTSKAESRRKWHTQYNCTGAPSVNQVGTVTGCMTKRFDSNGSEMVGAIPIAAVHGMALFSNTVHVDVCVLFSIAPFMRKKGNMVLIFCTWKWPSIVDRGCSKQCITQKCAKPCGELIHLTRPALLLLL